MNTTTTTTTGTASQRPGTGVEAHEQESASRARDGRGRWASATGQEVAGGLGSCASGPRRQVRLRLTPTLATQLHALPHRARAEAVALIVNAGMAGIEPGTLLGYRQELRNLGLLLNQSLRIARGQAFDVVALEKAVAIVNQLVIR